MEFIDGDFFESLADISFGDYYQNFKHISKEELLSIDKDVIYVFINTERLMNLIKTCGEITNKKFVIISHNSDLTLHSEIKNLPNNIHHIFLQNYNGIESDKMSALPIGLERKRWFPEQEKQQKIEVNYKSGNAHKKSIDIYMNFNPQTNPIRKQWFNNLKDNQDVYIENLGNGNSFDNYINKLLSSRYVLSPPGNGIDCHRNWECLYLGIVPIIQRSNFTENIYGDMNVILIDDISKINMDYLNNIETNKEISDIKLSTEYWKNKILKYVK